MKILIDDNLKFEHNTYYMAVIEDGGLVKLLLVVPEGVAVEFFFAPHSKYSEGIACELYDEIKNRASKLKENEFVSLIDCIKKYKDNTELAYFDLIVNSKEFTETQVLKIIDRFKFSPTAIHNLKLNESFDGWLTIRLGLDEEKVFGEFVGEYGKGNFQFVFYQD